MYQLLSRNNRPHKARKSSLPLITLVGLCLIVVALELTGVTHIFHHKKTNSTDAVQVDTGGGGTSNNQKGEATDNAGASTKGSDSGSSQSLPAQAGSDKSLAPSNTTTLLVPTGDFVSAHHISQSSALTSVCNTTPGATCTIVFTKDGDSKSLTAQTTDSNGSTYWNNWTPQGKGLAPGTWQIQAIATLNGQSKTASDAMNLVVSQ